MKRDKRADALKKGDKIWNAGSSFTITSIIRKTQDGRSNYTIKAKGLDSFMLWADEKVTIID
jgi:hypothetical protein